MELTTQWSTLRTEAVWGLNAHVSGWIGFITYFMKKSANTGGKTTVITLKLFV